MKKLVYLMMVTMLFGFVSNQVSAQKKGNEIVCFKSSMDCADCEKTITEYLKFEKGVKDLTVNHVSNTILIEYKKGKNTEEGLAKAIEEKGYEAKKLTREQYNKIIAETNAKVHEYSNEIDNNQ